MPTLRQSALSLHFGTSSLPFVTSSQTILTLIVFYTFLQRPNRRQSCPQSSCGCSSSLVQWRFRFALALSASCWSRGLVAKLVECLLSPVQKLPRGHVIFNFIVLKNGAKPLATWIWFFSSNYLYFEMAGPIFWRTPLHRCWLRNQI